MMKGYDSYKDSGSYWLGLIPSSWKVSSLKNFVEFINGYAFKSDDYVEEGGVPIIRIGDINEVVYLTNTKKIDILKYKDIERFKLVYNDILIALTGATIGKSGVFHSNEDAYLNQRVAILRTKENLNQTFVRYFIGSDFFQEFIKLKCEGAAQENIGTNDIGNYKIAFPPLPEQTQIAAFLDHQTGLIDALIAKKEALIDKLKLQRQAIINEAVTKGLDPNVKLKDSGIEWLGEIPEEWEVVKLRRLVKDHRQGYYSSKEYDDHGYRVARITDIKENNILDLTDAPFYNLSENEAKDFILEKGDFVFQRTGAHKKIGVFHGDEPAIYGSFLIRFRFDFKLIDTEYLLLFFESNLYTDQLNSTIHGGVNPNIHAENIKDCYVVRPTLKDQKMIVDDFLKDKKRSIQLLDSLNHQIEKLKLYRQSLISEAVTGKIDVREWKPKSKAALKSME